MFKAFGSSAQFATYDEIEQTLLRRPSGSMAVMASRWAGGQPVGHAYLAVHLDNRVYLYDPHTRQYSGWPPHWGQDAVAQTAVGYLKPDGEPVQRGRWYNQFAAAAIGRVQGFRTAFPNGTSTPDRLLTATPRTVRRCSTIEIARTTFGPRSTNSGRPPVKNARSSTASTDSTSRCEKPTPTPPGPASAPCCCSPWTRRRSTVAVTR
ncbi:hypothetical protein H7H51_27810 [Mycolicibacterium farcinogenes]|nr:hypothetical protein [Mycolicibacterium farcinogenes]